MSVNKSIIKSEVAQANITTQGYLELEFLQENVTLTKDEVDLGWSYAKELNPSKNMGVILKTAKYSLLDNEARRHAMKEMETWYKVAIVVSNLGQRIMGKVAIKMLSSSRNIRIFDSEDAAIRWIKS